MPRPKLPPRLALRLEPDGENVWVIRDGQRYFRTGLAEDQKAEAEQLLSDFLAGIIKPSAGALSRFGLIYYISVAGSDTYPIKIGYSASPIAERIVSLQGGNPNILVCLATERGTPDDERGRHRQFRLGHIRGEWFYRSAALMDHIASLAGPRVIPYEPVLDAHLS